MGHTGVGRMDSGCLGGGVQLVVFRRLRLLNRHLDRIVVVFRMCPGEQFGSAIHFHTVELLLLAVGEFQSDLELCSAQRSAVLVLLADGDLSYGV